MRDHSCDNLVAVVEIVFFFQAEDGIRDLVRSRGLGDVYKRQGQPRLQATHRATRMDSPEGVTGWCSGTRGTRRPACPLYTSDAADAPPCVALGGRRITNKKKTTTHHSHT